MSFKIYIIEEQILIFVRSAQTSSIKVFASKELSSLYTTLSLILHNYLNEVLLLACSVDNFECS